MNDLLGPAVDARDVWKLIRTCHKAYARGNFASVRLDEIETGQKRGQLICQPDRYAVLCKRMSRASIHVDFAKRNIIIPQDAAFAFVFAGVDRYATKQAIDDLIALAKGALWVEIFEEDHNAREALLAAGLSYVATKITVGGDIKGLYCLGPSPVDALSDAELETLRIIDAHFVTDHELLSIQDEMNEYGKQYFAQHYSPYNVRESWTAFAIRGYDAQNPSFIEKPTEMPKDWKAANPHLLTATCGPTSIADAFTVTKRVIDRIPGDKQRVRFMRLKPSGELTRHSDVSDRDAGIADGYIARLHIPIITTPLVRFLGWDARANAIEQHWPEGALCYMDQRKCHAVDNTKSQIERVHIVVDVVSNPQLRAMLFAGEGHA